MTVEVKTTVAGRGFSYRPGTYQVPDDMPKELAEELIRAGHAVKAKSQRRGKSSSPDSGELEE